MPDILTTPFAEPGLWQGDAIKDDPSWIHHLSGEEIGTIDGALCRARRTGLELFHITAEDFPLGAFGERLSALRAELEGGRGFQLLRGVPALRHLPDNCRLVAWGLASHIGWPEPQDGRSRLMYVIADTGRTVDGSDTQVRAGLSPPHGRRKCGLPTGEKRGARARSPAIHRVSGPRGTARRPGCRRFESGAPSMTEAIACQADVVHALVPVLLPALRSGDLVALGVTEPEISPVLPETQSFHEASSRADAVSANWCGILVLAGTPARIIGRLKAETAAFAADAGISAKLVEMGVEPLGSTPGGAAPRPAGLDRGIRHAGAQDRTGEDRRALRAGRPHWRPLKTTNQEETRCPRRPSRPGEPGRRSPSSAPRKRGTARTWPADRIGCTA